MNEIQESVMTSPFDRIRHVDEAGEFWLARELGPEMGYKRWENIAIVLAKVRAMADLNGGNPDDLLRDVTKQIPRGKGACPQEVIDVRMTRRACSMFVVCADERKPEIAAGKNYFVVKTREAELQPKTPEIMSDDPLTLALQAALQNRQLILEANERAKHAKSIAEEASKKVEVIQAKMEEIKDQGPAEIKEMIRVAMDAEDIVDEMTIRGFNRKFRLGLSAKQINWHGQVLSKSCRKKGIMLKGVDDEKWGSINKYPLSLLRQWFRSYNYPV